MADRGRFLQSIRHRTRSGRYRPTSAPDVAWTPTGNSRERAPIEDPPARFLEELEALGGHGRRVENYKAAGEYVLSLARERGAELLVRWDVEELERLDVDVPLRESGVEVAVWRELENFREVVAKTDVGLSTAEWAIAETGSLVIEGGPEKGRSVTLLPSAHVAVLLADRVLPAVPDAIAKYAADGRVPANLTFHTGPSRTGDIEMTLAVGVHGPGEVHVVLVG
ncbi:MAG TPA: lactate utilization protein [Rubrobacteraceae bacterium]|nr:lactate utilization protein [Rubrobacteraceae bacterium]